MVLGVFVSKGLLVNVLEHLDLSITAAALNERGKRARRARAALCT
jgi:hypothetical protein